MSSINDDVFDNGLNQLSNINEFHICSQEPTTYAEVATYSLGNKPSPTIGSPADATSGREVLLSAITDGTVTSDGTATHYALIDTVNSILYITGDINPDQAVVSGATFTFPETSICNLQDPTT